MRQALAFKCLHVQFKSHWGIHFLPPLQNFFFLIIICIVQYIVSGFFCFLRLSQCLSDPRLVASTDPELKIVDHKSALLSSWKSSMPQSCCRDIRQQCIDIRGGQWTWHRNEFNWWSLASLEITISCFVSLQQLHSSLWQQNSKVSL